MRARPISATVFAILNIGYGGFNLLGLLFLQVVVSMGDKVGPHSPLKSFYTDPSQLHWLWISGLIGGISGLFLMAAGVGLFFCANWARLTSVAWAGFDILFVLASTPMSWKYAHAAAASSTAPAPMAGAFTVLVTVLSVVFSLVYPVALLIFMTRPKLVAACSDKA